VRRHADKSQAGEYGEAEMRDWYRGLDLLPGGIEEIVPASSSLEDTVRKVMADAGLDSGLTSRVPSALRCGPPADAPAPAE
jgi:hypothetical protein